MRDTETVVPNPFTSEDLVKVVYGACLLGSGGGGPLSVALPMAKGVKGPVHWIDANGIPEPPPEKPDYAIVLACLGAPSHASGTHGLTAPVNVCNVLTQYLQSKDMNVKYVIPGELGTANTIVPYYVASQLEGSLMPVNGDPAGRAMPTLDLTLLAMAGYPICPAAIASDTYQTPKGDTYDSTPFTDPTMTPEALEAAAVEIVTTDTHYDSVGGMGCYPVTTSILKDPGLFIPYTVSTAWTIGDAIQGQQDLAAVTTALTDCGFDNYVFVEQGTLISCTSMGEGGFDVGKFRLLDDAGNDLLWIYYQNESLFAYDFADRRARAMGPDGISFFGPLNDEDPPTPKSNADVVPGKQYAVVGIACYSQLSDRGQFGVKFRADALGVINAFKDPSQILPSEYIPIKELNSSS